MAGSLPPSGVSLVAQGADTFYKALSDATKAIEQLGTSASGAATPVGGLGTTAAGAGKGFSALQEVAVGALRQVGAVAVDALGKATQAVAAFVGDSVGLAGDFEAGMNQFGAAAGDALKESGTSLDQFKELFISLGAELPVSTSEVQAAATALVKGGLDPATIAAGGLKAELQFAAAAEMDLVSAAELGIKMLGVYGPANATAAQQVEFLAHTNDLLVKAAGASTLNVDTLGKALLVVAGQAKALGVQEDDLVTTMGLISPGFNSAAEAGTSLKNMFARLQPATRNQIDAFKELGLITKEGNNVFFDSTGAFLGNRNAAEQLQKAFAGLSDADRIRLAQAAVGNDAMGALLGLTQAGASGYDAYADKMAKANGVQAQAIALQQGFDTAVNNAKGSLEALQLAIGGLVIPVLTSLLNNAVAPLINAFRLLVSTGDLSGFFQSLGSMIAPISPHFAALAQTVAFSLDPMAKIVELIDGAIPGFAAFTNVLAQIPAFFASAATAIGPFLAPLQGALVPALVGLAAVLGGSIVVAIGTFVASLAVAAAPVLALAAVAGVLYAAWSTNFLGIQGIVSGAMAGVMAIVSSVGASLVSAWQTNGAGIIATAQSTWTTVSAAVSSAVGVLGGIVSSILGTIVGVWTANGAQIVATTQATWTTAVSTVGALVGSLVGIITPVLAIIQGFIAAHGAEIQALFAQVWSTAGTVVQAAMAIIGVTVQATMALIQGAIIPTLTGVGAFIAAHSAQIQAILSAAWTVISTVISTVLSVIQGVITATMQAVQGNWSGAWQTIQNTCATIVQGILTVIKTNLAIIPTIISTVFDGAVAILAGFVGQFSKLGSDMVHGIADGIRSAAGAVFSAISSVISDGISAARHALDSKSPSKVTADQIGVPFTQGIAQGIGAAAGTATTAAANAAQGIVSAAQNALGIHSASTVAADQIGLPFVQGLAKGINDSGDLITAASKRLSKQLTDEMTKVAKDVVADFVRTLQAGFAGATAFKSTALDNLKHTQDLKGDTSGLKSEQEKLKQLQDELTALQNPDTASGGAATPVDTTKADADRDDKLEALRVKSDRESEDYQHDYKKATDNLAELVQERDAKIAAVQSSTNFDQDYYDQQGKLVKGKLSQIADLQDDYTDKIADSQDRVNQLNIKHNRDVIDTETALKKIYDDHTAAVTPAATTASAAADNSAAIAQKQAEILAQQTAVAAEAGRLEQRRQIAAFAADQIAQEKVTADKIAKVDAKAGSAYYALRSQQILDLADLQAQQADARAKGDNAASDAIDEQILLTKELQAAQLTEFIGQTEIDNPYKQTQDDLKDLQTKLQAELTHDKRFRDMNDKGSNSKDERERWTKINREVLEDQAALDKVTEQLNSIGQATITGIISGMEDPSQVSAITQAAVATVTEAQKALQDAFEIHSPSKVFAKTIGMPLGQGIGVGFTDSMSSVWSDMGNLSAPAGAFDAISGLTNPTLITPPASASQIANSSTTNNSTGMSIGTFNAPGGISRSEALQIFNQLYAAAGGRSDARRRMG